MKNLLSLLLVICVLFSFTACNFEYIDDDEDITALVEDATVTDEETPSAVEDTSITTTTIKSTTGTVANTTSTTTKTTSFTAKQTTAAVAQIELCGPYKVVRVVDGDTIIIDLDGEKTRVRFANVDTPESVASPESGKVNTAEGVVASDYTKELLPAGSFVYLEYDEKVLDKFDRVLAYIYLSDKKTMVQRLLLSNGLAKVFNDYDNTRYTAEFYKLQDKAKASGLGIWKDSSNG